MNLMEHQGKELFRRAGIPVPRGQHATTADDAANFVKANDGEWVIKAQVLMGGRGKAGKVKFAKNSGEAKTVARDIMATPMPPNRQNPKGEPVNSILVEEKLPIAKEAYCAIAIDRTTKRPVMMVSRFGGMDIEEVSEKHPESIAKFFVDTAIGYSPFIGRDLAFKAELDPGYRKAFPAIAGGIYDLFFRYGAKLIEINPLVLTTDGRVFASDSKVELDDDALYKNPEFKKWEETLPLDEDETLAAQAGLGTRNFRRFDGNVGTIANGAAWRWPRWMRSRTRAAILPTSLTWAAAQMPSASATATSWSSITPAQRSCSSTSSAASRAATKWPKGIVEAINTTQSRKVPLVIRLTGTNEDEGRRILADAKMTPVETMDEGAARAVELAR